MTKDDDRLSRAEMRALAREHLLAAYETLISIVRDPKVSRRSRDAAMKTLVVRGFIKRARRSPRARLH